MDEELLQEMVNHSLLRVAEFPDFGKTHFDILGELLLTNSQECNTMYYGRGG